LNFEWEITIPAGTTETAPHIKRLKIVRGVLRYVRIHYPAGCHSLVKTRLLRWETHLIPLTRGEWSAGDDETVEYELFYEIEEDPLLLTFIGISPTCVYDHTLRVRITILPKIIASLKPLYILIAKIAKRIFGITI